MGVAFGSAPRRHPLPLTYEPGEFDVEEPTPIVDAVAQPREYASADLPPRCRRCGHFGHLSGSVRDKRADRRYLACTVPDCECERML